MRLIASILLSLSLLVGYGQNVTLYSEVNATGTDTYVGALTPVAQISYVSGLKFTVKFANDNTGSATLNINSLGAKTIKKDGANLTAGDISSNDTYWVTYDGTNFRLLGGSGGGGGSSTYASDIVVSLSGGKTIGRYTNGQTIPSAGKTAEEVTRLIAIEYIDPVFNSFSISGQATTVEVGTTLSGSKTFVWSISANSGVVSTIDLYNNTTSATLLSATPNDGTQAQTITTIQLNSNGATQSWKGIGNNSSPSGTFNSSNFVVTGRYYRFFGSASASPTNSATVRALSSSAFHTVATTFTLATGNSLTKFVVALPPSVTISSVIDTDALGADITSSYVLTGTISVTDAGGTSRTYNIYEMNIGAAYSSSHNHSITTAN